MWHRKTLEDLSYFKVRDTVASFCSSQEACELLKTKLPFTDSQKIDELKTLSREWEKLLTDNSSIKLNGWDNVHPFLKILRTQGSTLEQNQFYALLTFTDSTLKIITTINTASKKITIKNLLSLTQKLPQTQLSTVNAEISKIIDKDGNIKDIPALREIKEKIAHLHTEISSALKKYTADSSLSTVLASNVPAFRADRQVLAVKANMKKRISGIVHEVSSSGQTIYIEPDEVVRKNNELIQEEFHLQSETRKIFTELTSKISPFEEFLTLSLKLMIKLDQTYAACRWGLNNKCTWALNDTESDGKTFPPALLQARHPLLGEKAVPIDMAFLPEKNVLIITGPNTGGKTVSIKTFALFALLNQTGFPLPAGDGTRLPIFNSIFADIGDEQSIDQSLSTFSAHMKNIAAAVKHADDRSLVLLDELGSGTDPQEGGAIGMAVLDELIEKKAFTLVTTHHGILKNYGYTNKNCINASVDFDSTTLSPTYKLLMGIPGESHALDIAKRSGLPAMTVKKAKSYINTQQADVSTLIKGLTQKHAELIEIEKQTKARESLLIEKELKFEQKLIKIRQEEISLKERENLTESIFISQTRKELENLVRTIREGEITREKTLAVKSFINELSKSNESNDKNLQEEKIRLENQKIELEKKIAQSSFRSENGILISKEKNGHNSTKKTKKKLSNKEALANAKSTYTDEQVENLKKDALSSFVTKERAQSAVPAEFERGAEVIYNLTKAHGTLLEQTKKGEWAVQLGSIRMNIKESLLTLTSPSKLNTTISLELADNPQGQSKPLFELRLLGMREEEAIKALEKQLDLCQIHNFKNFSIIHGKGNGILQQSVHNYLSHYSAVKSFNFASPEDGGFGKTYVELF